MRLSDAGRAALAAGGVHALPAAAPPPEYVIHLTQIECSEAGLDTTLRQLAGDYAVRWDRSAALEGAPPSAHVIFETEVIARHALEQLGGGIRGAFRVLQPSWAAAPQRAPARGGLPPPQNAKPAPASGLPPPPGLAAAPRPTAATPQDLAAARPGWANMGEPPSPAPKAEASASPAKPAPGGEQLQLSPSGKPVKPPKPSARDPTWRRGGEEDVVSLSHAPTQAAAAERRCAEPSLNLP